MDAQHLLEFLQLFPMRSPLPASARHKLVDKLDVHMLQLLLYAGKVNCLFTALMWLFECSLPQSAGINT